ncbi:polyprenyl synthetase family protein [Terrarubrum flagellatum]|uniref:polyprenyl synthetase family protein n=1 Tax=Terrirubrum flagellatum TaxID=2895980 RepID=UPI003145684A
MAQNSSNRIPFPIMDFSLDRFSRRLSGVAVEVETVLGLLLANDVRPGEIARPPRLAAAMRHATLGGGKRLRAFLLIETASMFGSTARDGALRAAAAVECLHAYSLVHDDLPAMDDDDVRRGRPTVHRAFDEATAILAGDALLTFAFDILSDAATHPDASVRIALVRELAIASGLGGMVGGQMLDLAAEGRFETERAALDEAQVRQIQAMKTGALIRASVMMGAEMGRVGGNARAALAIYAEKFGAAFQIADDILDLEASAETIGKATGKDDAKGKATLANTLGLDRAKMIRDRLAEEAIASLAGFGEEADTLREAAMFAAARQS